MKVYFDRGGNWMPTPETGGFVMSSVTVIEAEWNSEWTGRESCLRVINGNIIFDSELDDRYKQLRKDAYPSWQDQLDYIFHNGIAGWKSKIKAVKDKYPKP